MTSINIGDTGTATAASGAATCQHSECVVTSESITTAAAATYTLVLTSKLAYAASLALASVWLGSSTTGTPQVVSVTPAAGTITVIVKNIHASAAFNGTIVIGVVIL